MIVDSSALVAILGHEPERYPFLDAIRGARRAATSAATYVETAIVVDGRRDAVMSRRLDELIAELDIRIEPVTATQAQIARQAYRDFGRGSGHPARLNFGDCLSYALAKDQREPLLYKGDDFVHTDIRPAV
jgi:ribonuclease VapC